MTTTDSKKKTPTVPLLCWDIYSEYLDTLLPKKKIDNIRKRKVRENG
jgi:hypothetical protein